MDVTQIKNKLTVKNLKNISNLLLNKAGWLLGLISLILLSYCGYLWYTFIFNPHWSESRKQEYVNSKGKEVVFDKERFDAVTGEIEKRKIRYQQNTENITDIFHLKK